MPHDPTFTNWDNSYSYVTTSVDTGTAITSATTNLQICYTSAGTTATVTGGNGGILSNWNSYYGMLGNYGTTVVGGYSGGGGGTPRWEPVQAAALRKDWKELRTSWKRKRAEIKAKRLFRRVVGEIAFGKFLKRGFHEIFGASRQRYRLRPGFRVQVMAEKDTVDYELCAHLEIGIPWYDSMAVQHLMLTASKETEDKFRSIANKHPAHGPYPVPELTEAA